jgi:hypothetical protein
MSIRNPIDIAAAITAGSAVDTLTDHPERRPATFASAPVFAFAGSASAIRIGELRETAPVAPAKKRIPGQTYH